jgi:hypothetical protein
MERIQAMNRAHDSEIMERRNIERQQKREGMTMCQSLAQVAKTGHKESPGIMENRTILRMHSERFLNQYAPLLEPEKLKQKLANVRRQLQLVSDSRKKEFDKRIQQANLNLAKQGKDVIRNGGDFEGWSNEARSKRKSYVESFILQLESPDRQFPTA